MKSRQDDPYLLVALWSPVVLSGVKFASLVVFAWTVLTGKPSWTALVIAVTLAPIIAVTLMTRSLVLRLTGPTQMSAATLSRPRH